MIGHFKFRHYILGLLSLTTLLIFSQTNPIQSRSVNTEYELFIGDVRGGTAENYVISKIGRGKGFEYIGRRYQSGECPSGFNLLGGIKSSHGFWACINNEIAKNGFFTFYVGDVVNHRGFYYELTEEGVAEFGERSWDFCNEGYEVAVEKYKDGFWVCRGDF